MALVLGKPLGIAGATALGVRGGLGRLPRASRGGHVLGGAALSGIGFTVSLLIADLAFDDERLREEATVGVLLALVLATAAGSLAFWVGRPLPARGGRRPAPLPRPPGGPGRGPHPRPRGRAPHAGGVRRLRVSLLRPRHRGRPASCAPGSGTSSATCSGTCRCATCTRGRRSPRTRPSPRTGRAVSGRCTTCSSRTRTGSTSRTSSATPAGLELDVDVFLDDLHSREVDDRVRSDVASAEASGARGTPTFFIGERRHSGPYDAETLAVELTRCGRPADTGER